VNRVLVLAYCFPPIVNSGTQRPLKFVKYLAEHGWEPIVVTATGGDGNPTDESLLSEVPPAVRVVRVPMLHESVASGITRLLGGGALGKKVGDAVGWRLGNYRRVPDMYAWWQPTAVRAARRIFDEGGFDAIYATGFPWTTLLVGREVSRITGKPLIADFRDPWTLCTWFKDERPSMAEELAAERSVVEQAHTVLTTTHGLTRLMSNAYPSVDPAKFVTVHNGFDPDDMTVPPAPRSDALFRIVYTGVWKEKYNIDRLYNTIDWLRRSAPDVLEGVEVVTAGYQPGEAGRRGLQRYIKETGLLPHHEAVALMRSADLLYLSYEDPDRQFQSVAGKLYEYLATGRPVMALADPRGDLGQIIARVGGGVVVPFEDPGNLYQALLDACRRRMVPVPPRRPEELAAFERRALTGKLAGVLNAALNRAPMAARTPEVTLSDAPIRAVHVR
jgi:glycosyltransferase involved in cell wall biosynthesis